jgi:hypothetical protein
LENFVAEEMVLSRLPDEGVVFMSENPMPRLLKFAAVLGVSPLLVGSLIYGVWRVTRWHWLETAGLFTVVLGSAAFVAGMIALVLHVLREGKDGRMARSRLWPKGVLVGGVLLANFPAAFFFILSAIDVSARYTLRLHNDSDRPIESLVVTGPGVRLEFGPIAPGRDLRWLLHFAGEGPLDFSARQSGFLFGGQLDGYVTTGSGGEKSIRVRRGAEYEIKPAAVQPAGSKP